MMRRDGGGSPRSRTAGWPCHAHFRPRYAIPRRERSEAAGPGFTLPVSPLPLKEAANDVGSALTLAEAETILEVVQVDAAEAVVTHQRAQRIRIKVVEVLVR